ncbi:MAG: CocE/NonD family hydrolase [Bacteroidota bacterium]
MLPPIRTATSFAALLILLLAPCFLPAQSLVPSPYDPPPVYKKMVEKSFYLSMRDGVELACDLFLPRDLPPGDKIPTVLHITRYWRAFKVKFPFNLLLKPGTPGMNLVFSTERLVKAGYAVLTVDARGSGASFGSEMIAMGPDEVADGAELLDWITAQDWSDGQVAATGISYNGWAAQMLAVNRHPALKAIIPIHAPFDGFDDMAVPGGLFNRGLIYRWSDILRSMDQGLVNSNRKVVKALVNGPQGVRGRKVDLNRAYRAHHKNGYADVVLHGVQYRDDTSSLVEGRNIDAFFPAGHLDAVRECNAPVYAVSGWYDMAGPRAATRILHNYGSGQNKLLIGPWNHFASLNISPHAPGKATFDRTAEFIKFLDAHLKGRSELLRDEAPVHYYTIGAERWRAAQEWPPAGARPITQYFAAGGMLLDQPSRTSGRDTLRVDTSLGTGHQTRWDLSSDNKSTYKDLPALQEHWVTYTTPVLEQKMEITGHPAVRLHIASPQTDESLFVYLEEITAEGQIFLITEGLLRASHRRPATTPLYTDVVPHPSFQSTDATPLVAGEVTAIDIHLLPCSWEVQPGSRIRIAISGADADHFDPITGNHSLEVCFGGTASSSLVLPVMDR